MKSHERSTMTPLEMAVWGAAFASRTSLNLKDADVVRSAMRAADFSVALLRGGIEAERAQEALDDAKAKHQTRIVKVDGIDTLRCSCGYQPRQHDAADVDEMMSLHLAAMRALGPDDLQPQRRMLHDPNGPPCEGCPNSNCSDYELCCRKSRT